jgi:glyceraldehyde 3-phosphate dehydrogenase
VGLVLPELNGKLDGFRHARADHQRLGRRPHLRRPRDDQGRDRRRGEGRSRRPLKGILGFNKKPLVSVDFNHDPRSSVYDAAP